ncbi:MAG: hypothetical protein ACTSSH_04280 [Candidatus Heimdallarchaeota archaeon]
MSEEKKKTKTKTEVIEEEIVEEETSELEKIKEKNVVKIKMLIEELDKIERKRDPNIRICPRCLSLRVKMEDVIARMGINASYPVYVCSDCGWRSKNWIYLDRTMSEDERESFFQGFLKEDSEK